MASEVDKRADNVLYGPQRHMSDVDCVLFRAPAKLRIAELCRYTITYRPSERNRREALYIRVANLAAAVRRAAYLLGPHTLYADVRSSVYDEMHMVQSDSDHPQFANNIRAGASCLFKLPIGDFYEYQWTLDVISEIIFSRSASVEYEVTIGTSASIVSTNSIATSDPLADAFSITVQDTATLWSTPKPRPNEPLHLVVLTHGFLSNVTADMFYIKERIDKMAQQTGENLIVRGYTGNVCRTERGICQLGRRLGLWIMNELVPTYKPAKMSLIAHSLGGCVQTYALGFIENASPGFFKDIQLVNFIAMASPFLGISTENPVYIRLALDVGIAGKTGRELGLSWNGPRSIPKLEALPHGSAQIVLQQFSHRTVYANSVNDGLVPLRTSALLYLDWHAIARTNEARKGRSAARFFPNLPSHISSLKAEDLRSLEIKKNQSPFSKAVGVPDGPKWWDSIFRKSQRPSTLQHSGTPEEHLKKSDAMDNFELPKKASLFESGLSVLFTPLPDREYIEHPLDHVDAVFHDKIYSEKDLPPRKFRFKSGHHKSGDKKIEISHIEERIARAYHHKLSWRKVLVQIQPDAHNNIIVRRRFSNAYGWPVVEHMVLNHFLPNVECNEGPKNTVNPFGDSVHEDDILQQRLSNRKDFLSAASPTHDDIMNASSDSSISNLSSSSSLPEQESFDDASDFSVDEADEIHKAMLCT